MENFIEQLVSEYYKSQGYFVTTNHWFAFDQQRKRTRKTGIEQIYDAQGWSDIDVLSMNEKELLIIQVKAVINTENVPDNIIQFFGRAEEYLNKGKAPDGMSDIEWWTKDRRIKKMVIYEYNSVPSYIKRIQENGIQVLSFSEFFDKIINYIHNKKGTKEQSSLMRMIHFLNNEGYFPKEVIIPKDTSVVKHKLLNHKIQKDTESLIIGTFNPDSPNNEADFFYGRSRNHLWTLIANACGVESLKGKSKAEKKSFIKKHKIDFIDIIDAIKVEQNQEENYDDAYIDSRVINWQDIIALIKKHKGIKRVGFTRKSFGDVPNIKYKIEEVKSYCESHDIKFSFLVTPARFINEDKQKEWSLFFNK